jgi:hypothetical protein
LYFWLALILGLTEEKAMSKQGSSRPPSNQPVNGGNWPSTTGNPSGAGRGNAIPAPAKR